MNKKVFLVVFFILLCLGSVFSASALDTFLSNFSKIPEITINSSASLDARGFSAPGSMENSAYLAAMKQMPGLNKLRPTAKTFPQWKGIVDRYFTINTSKPVLGPTGEVVSQTYTFAPKPNAVQVTVTGGAGGSGGVKTAPINVVNNVTVNNNPTVNAAGGSATANPTVNATGGSANNATRINVTGGSGAGPAPSPTGGTTGGGEIPPTDWAKPPVREVITPEVLPPEKTPTDLVPYKKQPIIDIVPIEPKPQYEAPSRSSLFKGALIYGAVSGLNDAIIEYETSFKNDPNRGSNIVIAGFTGTVLNTAMAYGVAWGVTRSVGLLATKSATINSIALGVSKFANPIGIGLLIGTVIGTIAFNKVDSGIFNDIPTWSRAYSRPVSVLFKYELERTDLLSDNSELGTSSNKYKLSVNIDQISQAKFYVGNSGKDMIPGAGSNGLVEAPEAYSAVPGQYIISVDGIAAKALHGFEIYKSLAENPTGWEKFGRGVFSVLSGGTSNNRRDSQLGVANAMIPLLKKNLLQGVQYYVYSSDSDGNLDIVGSGDCLINNQTRLIDCTLRGKQLEEEGFYLFLIRLKFMDSELLHFYPFDKSMEDSDLCGFFPRYDVSPGITKLTCGINVAGLYDLNKNEYTTQGKESLAKLKERIDFEVNKVQNEYPPLAKKFIEGYSLLGSNIYQLYGKVDPSNKDYKHSNVATLLGYPLFGVFIVGKPVLYLDDPIAEAVGIDEDYVFDTSALGSGSSFADYLKLTNAKSLISSTAKPSAVEVAKDSKPAVPVVKDTPKGEVKGGGTVTWNNILPTQESTIIFPSTNIGGKSYQLKLEFSKSKWNFIKYLKVYVNNSPVDCYYDAYGSFWNSFGGSNALVYGWGEERENCDYSVDSKYVLSTKLSSSGGYYSFDLTSPIIPESCNGETLSQSGTSMTANCS